MYYLRNKIGIVLLTLFCFAVPVYATEKISPTTPLAYAGRVASVPLTAFGSSIIGTALTLPLLLVMDNTQLLQSNIPVVGYLTGFSYGVYRGYDDVKNEELSLYSKMASGTYILVIAAGLLLRAGN